MCKYNVASTSMRHDVASTLRRRYIYVMCLPGRDVETEGSIEFIRGFHIFYSKQISYVLGDFHLCSYFF